MNTDILVSFWNALGEEDQDKIIGILVNDTGEEKTVFDDQQAAKELQDAFGITVEQTEAFLDMRFAKGYSSVSREAVGVLNPLMRHEKLHYASAVKRADFPVNLDVMEQDKLEYYGKVLVGDVQPDPRNDVSADDHQSDEKRYGTIPNPTVHIALNRIRRVINELIYWHGKPSEIHIELARDLPLGAEGKKDITKHQNKNQKENERIDAEIRQYAHISRDNRQRYKLWEELDKDNIANRRCVFTGQIICIEQLFSPEIEVAHLLP